MTVNPYDASESYDDSSTYDYGPIPLPVQRASAQAARQMSVPFAIDAAGRVAFTIDPDQQVLDRVIQVIATDITERMMVPEFGIALRASLFAPLEDELSVLLKTEIQVALNNYEPGVQVIDVIPTVDNSNGLLGLQVLFQSSGVGLTASTQAAFIPVGAP